VLAGAWLVAAAVAFGLLLFLVQDEWRPLLRVDEGARDDLHRYAVAHHGFVSAMRVLSTIGSAYVYLPLFALLAAWLVRQGRRRMAAFVAVTVALSPLINLAAKHTVDRARPVLDAPVAHASGLSFPSGHAQAATVAVLVLMVVFLPRVPRAWRPLAMAAGVGWIAAIGLARVGLGVHYVSDVLAGSALGAAWVAAAVSVRGSA
jgi:undecaprenyl-diphosphatase